MHHKPHGMFSLSRIVATRYPKFFNKMILLLSPTKDPLRSLATCISRDEQIVVNYVPLRKVFALFLMKED